MAATLCLSACKKQQTTIIASTSESTQITDADFKDGRATLSGQKKQTENGLEMDYDLVIKEVSENKYQAAIKINGIKLNGKKPNGYKESNYKSIVLALNTSKEDKSVPLDVLLKAANPGSVNNGDIVKFPEFEYKGNLKYNVVNASTAIAIDNPVFTPSGGVFSSALRLSGIDITVPNSSISINGGNFEIRENSSITINGGSTIMNFGLVLSDKLATIIDRDEYFVLPSGHTVEQNPEVAKVTLQEEDGYVIVVVSGDPAQKIAEVYYKPAPISANDPKDPKATIQLPVMEFALTHFNQKNGIQRFKSKQTFKELYKDQKFGISTLSISLRSKI